MLGLGMAATTSFLLRAKVELWNLVPPVRGMNVSEGSKVKEFPPPIPLHHWSNQLFHWRPYSLRIENQGVQR